MPIPTRSQSVRTASKAPLKPSQHEEARKTTRADANTDSRPRSRPSALPQPLRQPSVASHQRSQSTTVPSTRVTDQRTHSTTVSFTRATHQRAGSISRPPLHHGSQTSSFSDVSGSSENGTRTLKPPQRMGILKPNFSTYQQHFSPRKPQARSPALQTKIDTLEHSNASPQEAFYSSRLQDELLQLSLVHLPSRRTLYDFERSVKEKLALAAHELDKEYEVVSALETECQKSVNARALFIWLQDENPDLKDSKVQDLSFCIRELTELRGNGCLFEQLMTEFAQWLENAQKVIPMLSEDMMSLESDNDNVLFLGPPGVPWWQGIDECSTRLALCQKLLTGLGKAEPDTGIGIVLSRHRRLAAVMLDKIHTAQDIINAVTASQEQFRSQALTAVLNDAAAEDRNDDRNWI